MNRLPVRFGVAVGGLVAVSILIFALLSVRTDFAADEPGLTKAPLPGQRPPRANPRPFWLPAMLDETPQGVSITWRNLLILSSLVTLASVGGGLFFGHQLSAPFVRIVQAAQKLGAGRLDTRVDERGSQEQVNLARAFNRMSAALQHGEQLRRNMLADVSHELRTPLTVLEANLRAALDGVIQLTEPEIARLYAQTHHLTRLVDDLHQLAVAEAGQLRLNLQDLAPDGLVRSVSDLFESPADEKRLVVACQYHAPHARVMVDEVRIRQVLHNIFGNAIRHTPEGGRITVSTGQTAGMWWVTIADSGDGMDEREIAQVFNRFFRADESRSRETGGSGLGLAIAQALVVAHGGSVKAESAGHGRGSSFRVALPCSNSTRAA